MENNFINSKHSQITLFVIIGIVIILAAVLIFLFIGNPFSEFTSDKNIKEKIESEIYETLKDSVDKTLENNGYFSEVQENYIVYSGEKIPYLCTVSEFYIQCTPQEPMFVNKIKRDLEQELQEVMNEKYKEIKQNSRVGYNIQAKKPNISIEFKQNSVVAISSGSITTTKGESTKTYSDFQVELKTPLYKLSELAQTIVNYESTLCEFDKIKWQALHSDIKIKRFRTSDQTKIYTLVDKNSDEKIKFAIKTCVLPAGI